MFNVFGQCYNKNTRRSNILKILESSPVASASTTVIFWRIRAFFVGSQEGGVGLYRLHVWPLNCKQRESSLWLPPRLCLYTAAPKIWTRQLQWIAQNDEVLGCGRCRNWSGSHWLFWILWYGFMNGKINRLPFPSEGRESVWSSLFKQQHSKHEKICSTALGRVFRALVYIRNRILTAKNEITPFEKFFGK